MWEVMNGYTQSLADPAHGQQSRAIDFYNNDLFNATDNFIESDGGYANIRMLRNRCFNCLAEPVSVQFIYAGPVYWIRNIIWNTCGGKEAVKPIPWGEAPVFVFLHNTTSCHFKTPDMDSWDIRNNLFMGPADFFSERDRNNPAQRNFGRYVAPAAPHRTVDHNVYRPGLKLPAAYVVGNEEFASLEEMAATAGFEKCGLELTGYDIFAKAAEPNHAGSGNMSALVHPRDYDLRPAAGSPIIDAGAAIPDVNDGFTGTAPDIGAEEAGRPATVYGPRSGPYLERLKQLRAGTYTPAVADTNPLSGLSARAEIRNPGDGADRHRPNPTVGGNNR
jgi:hypothetical protein